MKMYLNISLFVLLMFFCFTNSVANEKNLAPFQEAYSAYNEKIKAGEKEAAIPFAKEAYLQGFRIFEANSEDLLALADNYAVLLIQTGQPKTKAEDVYLKLLNLNERYYGAHAKSLIPILEMLYKISSSEDRAKSEQYQIRYLKLYSRNYPHLVAKKNIEPYLKKPKGISKRLKKLKNTTKQKFVVFEGDHWLILHPKGLLEGARSLNEQLEISYKSIRSFFIAMNLSINPIDEKLIVIMHDSYESFENHTKKLGLRLRARGSYFEKVDTFITYDVPINGDKDKYFKRVNFVVKEAFQQVAVAAEVLSNNRDIFPRWIYDGLSYTFEFNKIDEPFGPHANNISAKNWSVAQDLIDEEQWISLKELIRFVKNEEHTPKNSTVIYAMSTYLLRYLYEKHPEEIVQYLNILARGTADKQGSRDREKAFYLAFGSIDKMENDWKKSLKKVGLSFSSF